MGCDIHVFTEQYFNGNWHYVDLHPFKDRSYGVFAFLAGVRNYSGIDPIRLPKGVPADKSEGSPAFEEGFHHTPSHLSVWELSVFDYDQPMVDHRCVVQTAPNVFDGGGYSEEGKLTTYREFLGEWFFKDLDMLKKMNEEHPTRIVFWFDC